MKKMAKVQNNLSNERYDDEEVILDDAKQTTRTRKYRGSWANLPDLVLEQIFQYLPYKVSTL